MEKCDCYYDHGGDKVFCLKCLGNESKKVSQVNISFKNKISWASAQKLMVLAGFLLIDEEIAQKVDDFDIVIVE